MKEFGSFHIMLLKKMNDNSINSSGVIDLTGAIPTIYMKRRIRRQFVQERVRNHPTIEFY